jgi:hypothetical protein
LETANTKSQSSIINQNQSAKSGACKKTFFAKQTQFQKPAKCPNSFSYRWLLKADGWTLSKKQTQTKPIFITDNWLLLTDNWKVSKRTQFPQEKQKRRPESRLLECST